jgi:hypothetical protein
MRCVRFEVRVLNYVCASTCRDVIESVAWPSTQWVRVLQNRGTSSGFAVTVAGMTTSPAVLPFNWGAHAAQGAAEPSIKPAAHQAACAQGIGRLMLLCAKATPCYAL